MRVVKMPSVLTNKPDMNRRQWLVLFGISAFVAILACCVWNNFVSFIIWGALALLGLLLSFVFFVSRPKWGVALLILELILGGNGHWFQFPGTFITPRYVLIPMVLLGYFAHKMIRRDFTLPHISFFSPLVFFGILVSVSVGQALICGNAEPFKEAQVWLYLLLYPIIVDLWRRRGIPVKLLWIVAWSIVAMALFQLVLMLLINLFPEIPLILYENTPLEAMRITMPVLQGIPGKVLRYVFWGNSSLCGVILAVSLLIIGIRRIKTEIISRAIAWKLVIIMCLAMVFSMTRGTWAQLVLTILLVGLDFLMNRKIPWRLAVIAVVVLLGVVWTFSSVPFVRDAFETRFGTLFADRATLDAGDSLVVKDMEQQQLCAAIAARPFFGYGFGLGDYREFGEDLVEDDRTRFHNYFLGFTLKTGIVGLAGLLFLLLGGCLRAMCVGSIICRGQPEWRAVLFGMAYGFAGVFLASTSNPHLGTPAVIAVFAFMLAFSDLVFNEWRKQKSAIRNSDGQT